MTRPETTAASPACASPALALQPVATEQRLEIVDVLRGLAILGILLENILFYGGPANQWQLEPPLWPGPADQLVVWGLQWLEQGKFFSLFALLFGFGMAMQAARSPDDRSFVRLTLRRAAVLLVFGALHVLLLWWGDILVQLAVLAVAFLPFRRLPQRKLLNAAAVLWLAPLLVAAGMAAGIECLRHTPALAAFFDSAAQQESLQRTAEADIKTYGAGTLRAICARRQQDAAAGAGGVVWILPGMLMMYILGWLAARRGIVANPQQHARLLRRLATIALPVGLLLHLAYVVIYAAIDKTDPGLRSAAVFALYALGIPPFTLGFISLVVLSARRAGVARVLRPTAAVGEMSLSNYILQSVIGTTIFYSYGLGLFGRVSPLRCMLLALVIYAGQVVLSNLWLRGFRYGPLEWLWRGLTYGRVPALRRTR